MRGKFYRVAHPLLWLNMFDVRSIFGN